MKSFADDTRAIKSVKSLDDASLLQHELNKIYEWKKQINMQLNDLKFEFFVLAQIKNLKTKQNTCHLQEKLFVPKNILEYTCQKT